MSTRKMSVLAALVALLTLKSALAAPLRRRAVGPTEPHPRRVVMMNLLRSNRLVTGLLAYVLNLEKASPTAAQSALAQGYRGGEASAGATLGAIAGVNSNSRLGGWGGAAVGGLVGSGASLVANSLVKDVTSMLVCDVSVRERVATGVLVRRDTSIDTRVSDAGTSQQRVSEATDLKEYRTRIVTTANKAKLQLEEASSSMFKKTAYAISGFF